MEPSKAPPHWHATSLWPAQIEMLDVLRGIEIVGAAGTAAFFIDTGVENPFPFMTPPFTVEYTVPVVMVAGKLRRVMPNGDLIEIEDIDRIDPPLKEWSR